VRARVLRNSERRLAHFGQLSISGVAQGAHRSGMTSANDIYAAASIAAAETTKITAMSTAAHM